MNTVNGNEIITMGIGQCGIHMLHSFISTLMVEHKIDKNGDFIGDLDITNDKLLMLKNNVYFENDQRNNKYIPRAIFMDIDKTHIDAMKSSYLGSLISADHFMSGLFSEPTVLWAKGHYTDGAETIQECLDTVRRQVETCDIPQGFQMFHSISGGWGGGFGTLLLWKIRDNYPDRSVHTYSVYPSTYKKRQTYAQHHDSLAVYNSILCIHALMENTDTCHTFDNGKLFDFALKYCQLQHPTYDDLNWILSQIMSGATSTLRFDCEPSVNVTQQLFNICFCPFPRLHFLTLCHSPFFSNKTYKYNCNVNAIISNLLENDVANVNLKNGKMLNVVFVYRPNDENAIDTMDGYTIKTQQKMTDDFVSWVPDNVQSSFIHDGDNFAYKKYSPLVTTAVMNTASIKVVFERLCARFWKLYKRKAHLHWYIAEGMDEMEFQEAHKNTMDLGIEYRSLGNSCVIDLDEDDYDDDDDDDYSEDDDEDL
eukprot:467814_1